MNNTNKIPMSQEEIDEMVETMSVMLDSRWVDHSASVLRRYIEEWRVNKFDVYQKMGGIIVDVPIKQIGEIEKFYAKYTMYKKAIAVVDRLYPTSKVGELCLTWERKAFVDRCDFLRANVNFLILPTIQQKNNATTLAEKSYPFSHIYPFMHQYLTAVKNDLFESPNSNPEILEKLSALDYNMLRQGFAIYPDVEEMYSRWGARPLFGDQSSEINKKYNENVKKQIEIIQELHPLIFGTSKSPKLTKAIGQFVTFGKHTEVFVEAIQLLISQLNNSIAVGEDSTRLKLSIHPMDFLTQSENDYGWRSCTAMDGEYNTSPFSLILDEYSMIAYAESARSNLKFTSNRKGIVRHWNNKKWRMLVHWNESMDAVGTNKHYPTEDSVLESNFIAFFMDKWDFIKLDQIDISQADGGNIKVFFADNVDYCEPYVYLDGIYNIAGDKIYIKRAEEFAEIASRDFGRDDQTLYVDFNIGSVTLCLTCGEVVATDEYGCDYDERIPTLCSRCQEPEEPDWDDYAEDEEPIEDIPIPFGGFPSL